MISQKEVESLLAKVPREASHEDHRAAASVAIGVRDDKTLSEIIKYYWLPEDLAKKWWTEFGFDNTAVVERKKRGSKTASLDAFVKANIGKTFNSSEIIEQCGITTPTFYNYMNANRGFFKKSGRGIYSIVDPTQERMQAKKDTQSI
jgi:hypothetical protein